MAQSVSELTGKEFDGFTKKGLVLVDFSADWCMPCVMMAPVMEELSKKFKGKIKFGKIDVDENIAIAQKFKIFSIPNFILFKDGEIKDRFVGAMSEEDFQDRLREHL
ncbi:thioredoxin [Candidatus Pacearchaeota archaeon]|nr:thioredoxin [Candidatus Pacearchaeota archaeon]